FSGGVKLSSRPSAGSYRCSAGLKMSIQLSLADAASQSGTSPITSSVWRTRRGSERRIDMEPLRDVRRLSGTLSLKPSGKLDYSSYAAHGIDLEADSRTNVVRTRCWVSCTLTAGGLRRVQAWEEQCPFVDGFAGRGDGFCHRLTFRHSWIGWQ